MDEKTKEEVCPLCGSPNSHSEAYCRRCQYRLPWAPKKSAENDLDWAAKSIARLDSVIEKGLRKNGLLSDRTVLCRFCNGQIEVNAEQCPHCKEYLTPRTRASNLDPWQSDYDEKDIEHVNMISPRTGGCLSVISLFVLAAALWFKP